MAPLPGCSAAGAEPGDVTAGCQGSRLAAFHGVERSIRRTGDGCQGERRTPGSRTGRTPVPLGADGLLSRALNGLPNLTLLNESDEGCNSYKRPKMHNAHVARLDIAPAPLNLVQSCS